MLARDLQALGRRLLICGMHVHVGLEDPELRIDLMSQASYFLPHLLALVDLVAVLAGRGYRAQELTAWRCSTNCRAPACRRSSIPGASISAT